MAATQVASDYYHRTWPLPTAADYNSLKPGGGYAMIFDRIGERIADPLDPTVEGIVYADVAKSEIIRPNGYDPEPFTVPADGRRP